ncbi:DNA glycosylase AlkZ-like family protein [Candidatus Hodarchaeum mangrovi]
MEKEIPLITREELKRLIVVGNNLHCWQGTGDEGIRKIIKEHGFIQLDPLNPAGRYHDIFFNARISGYKKGQFEKLAYPEKLVFETYFHNLNAVAIEHFPFFNSYSGEEHLGRYYTRLLRNMEQIGDSALLDDVFKYVKAYGSTKSSDLAKLGKADPKYASWKSNRVSGTALELLWALGKLMIVERDINFRKSYDLTERYVEEKLLKQKEFSEEQRQFYRLQLKLHAFPIISIGKISFTQQGKIKSSKKTEYSLEKHISLEYSENQNKPTLLKLDDETVYIVPSNWNELCQEAIDGNMRVIGPLDPIIWDRNLLKRLFRFDYVWEVYKRPQDRIWGYYVYPLLYQGDFIGRLEAKLNTKGKILDVFNFQKETNFDFDNKSEKAFSQMISRWKLMLEVDKVNYDNTLSGNMC